MKLFAIFEQHIATSGRNHFFRVISISVDEAIESEEWLQQPSNGVYPEALRVKRFHAAIRRDSVLAHPAHWKCDTKKPHTQGGQTAAAAAPSPL